MPDILMPDPDMAMLIRSHDWSVGPLGPPETWPQPLRTLLDVMLGSAQPMFVAWGPARTLIYNDAYAEILAAKHPAALGQPFLEVWHEIQADLVPIVEQAYRGEPVRMDDITLVMHRRGYAEETHFAFSYTPVHTEDGRIDGLFCACQEITDRVLNDRRLRESETRLRGVLDGMAEGFLLLDQDFRVLDINLEGLRLETRPRDAIIGCSCWDMWPGSAESEVGRLYRQAMRDRVPVALEYPYTWPNGRETWLDMRGYPTGTGLALFYRDVTERRRAAERADQMVERVQLSLEAGAIIGTWVWDVPTDRFTADERFARSFGIDPEHCRIGLPLSQVAQSIHEDDWRRVEEAIAEVLARGGPYRCEYRVRQADGCYRWIEANGRVELGDRGQALRFPGVLIGIDERKRIEAERDRADDLLRTFMEAVPGVVYAKDHQGRMLVANRGTAELIGKPTETFLGKTDAEFLEDKAQAKTIMATDRRIMEGGIAEQIEEEVRLPDGRPAVWLSTKAPLRNETGQVIGLIGSSVDVTVRKRLEDRRLALVQLTDRVRELQTPADIAYAAAEILGETLGVSRAGYGSIDAAAETITIERDWNAPGIHSLAGTLRFRDYGSFINDLKRGESVVFADAEKDPRTAGHAAMLKAISAQAIVNIPVTEQRGLVALLYLNHATAREWREDELAFVRDVAERTQTVIERRRAEAELLALAISLERQVEERTAERDRVWRHSRDLLVVADANGVFRAVNPAWKTILGHVPGEMVGRSFRDFVWHEDAERTQHGLENAVAQRDLTNFENRYTHKDGTLRWISWRTSTEDGFVYAYGRDITEERQQAEALRLAEETLRQSQKMEAVGQLTGGIAHDFNNMLAVVIGSLDLLVRRIGTADAGARRYIDAAGEAARRAGLLTQRLLAFSRQQPLRPEPVDANRLLAGMSDLLRHSLGVDIRLETVLAGGLWHTHADPNQLENVILNLAVNARDAMPEGGHLTMETQNAHLDSRYCATHLGVSAGQYVLIAVTDSGTGMPEEIIAKAFDPFFTTKGVGKGTGLGLSQVYGFVKQSGGHVKIYSEVGQGTTVKIYLRRLVGVIDMPTKLAVAAELPRGERHEVILVVEDEPAVRQLSVDALTELGYKVLEADGAATALRLFDAHPEIALLFTDIVMPDVNGRKLADEVRGRRPDLKVLFTTGYTRNAVVHNGVLDPGVELIGKPFTIEELAAKVRQMLDAPASGSSRS